MLINPLLILASLAILILIVIICIIKSPNAPILSACTILILGVYVFLAYIVNSAAISSEFLVSQSIENILLRLAVTSDSLSISQLEQAFNNFVVLIEVAAVLSIISLLIDIVRIFFRRSKV